MVTDHGLSLYLSRLLSRRKSSRSVLKQCETKICLEERFRRKRKFKFVLVLLLGVLIDKNLTWKPHIDHIASKISKIVGIPARIRHHVPFNILLQIYRSLIFPYTLYGIPVWGQAAQRDLEKILILQKRALRLIFFLNNRTHAIPLFLTSNILPVNMLYFETVSAIMHDVCTNSTPCNIRQLFIHSSDVHAHNTRSSFNKNFFIQESRLRVKLKSFSAFGAVYTPTS